MEQVEEEEFLSIDEGKDRKVIKQSLSRSFQEEKVEDVNLNDLSI